MQATWDHYRRIVCPLAGAAIAAVMLWSGLSPAHARTTAASDSSHPPRLSSAAQINAYLVANHFSGYILLERHGRILLSKGYGMADRKGQRPNTNRSRWPLLGTNRFITAIAILRLQDERRLSVQDSVCRYVAGCPTAWKRITIHQLLLDSSGLSTFDTSAMPGGPDRTLKTCKALPPVGAPGTVTTESRCNNLLLNTIIVRVTGKQWLAAMRELVFGPARMTDSGQLTNAVVPPHRVQGYDSSGNPEPLGNLNNYYAPISSMQDLERMDRALLSGRLLSRQALRALFTPYLSGIAVSERYLGANAPRLASGYECYLRKATRTSVREADKPGDVGGMAFDDALSPDDGSIAIVARNVDGAGPSPTDLMFSLAPRLLWGRQQ